MNVLVLNYGSSTLKWALLRASDEALLDSGLLEMCPKPDQARAAFEAHLSARSLSDVVAVGHRVVQGGTRFRAPVRIDAQVREALAALAPLDPLHAPVALAGIDAALAAMPAVPHVAAFDTAFHATIPAASALYPIPHEMSAKADVRKLGFHGLSVAYAARRVGDLLGSAPARLLVLHLGSGASLTAVKDGASFDTTMGMTPLDGVMMATRSGALDPGLVFFLERRLDLSPSDLERVLNERSGLLGVSGVSSDLRVVLAAADRGDARARLAYEMLVVSLRRQSGAMIGALGGLDALVFTGGMGEGSPRVRKDLCEGLAYVGVRLDPRANEAPSGDRAIGALGSTPAFVVHAREDLSILRDVVRVLGVGRWTT
jgi:acetate kinase